MKYKKIIVVGGGAGGIFSAIRAAELGHQVTVLEKNRKLLTKVAVSGGGRCNVTHSCFDPAELVKAYPRGNKELLGPFYRFQPRHTVEWFENRGVELKTESDGRMFPTTDDSQTIIDCLLNEAKKLDVEILIGWDVQSIEKGFTVASKTGAVLTADKLIIASGSSAKIHTLVEGLGHTIVPHVPSLFTFNLHLPWHELAGVSLAKVQTSIEGLNYMQQGPMVVTHWGFSGPAILKLSAWAARELHAMNYLGTLLVNWIPNDDADAIFEECRRQQGAKQIQSFCPFDIPKSIWKKLIEGIEGSLWAQLSKKQLADLKHRLTQSRFTFDGKSTNKEEFVTAGGVSLDEINFKNLESKKCPGLHFAGETLDIDGITGGYNFQNAWTTGWLAGSD
jgi:hypothetical protein